MNDYIIYELPLNEHLRICLRLEHLFHQAKIFLEVDSIESSQVTMNAILEIVNILERPDFKSKLVKALSILAQRLTLLENSSEIDHKKLKETIYNIDTYIDYLRTAPIKLAHSLRENDFLSDIRIHLAKPGGISLFNCPAYHFWLRQTHAGRIRDFNRWLKELEPMQNMINLLLQLTRESGKFHRKSALQGFYQEALDPLISYQIIRVLLPYDRKVYPEISVGLHSMGKHRLSIHFFSPDFETGAIQANHDIPFKLCYCATRDERRDERR